MRQLTVATFVFACSMFFASVGHAAPPSLMPVGGYLTDAGGAPISGQVTIRFRLYADAAGTTVLFEETPVVSVTNGLFAYYLGTDTPLALTVFRDNATVYLGMRVGTDAEATPLVGMGTAPYAAVAQYCGDATTLDGMSPTDFAPAVHTHDASQITGTFGAISSSSTVTATDYRYVSPNTYKRFVAGSEFVVAGSNEFGTSFPDLVTIQANGGFGNWARAPLHLDQGAALTGLTCYFSDDDATYNLSNVYAVVVVQPLTFTTAGTVIATTPTVTSSGTSRGSTVSLSGAASFQNHVVDNGTNAYWVGFTATTAAAAPSGTLEGEFHGCLVTYTLAGVSN